MIKSRRMRWAGYLAHVGEERNPYSVLVRTADIKGPLGRLSQRGQGNMKMGYRVIGWGSTD
jgi:hypothetical protein